MMFYNDGRWVVSCTTPYCDAAERLWPDGLLRHREGHDYGITRAMSVPQLARHMRLRDAQTLRDMIANGEGPRVIRIPGAQRDTIRVLRCHAIAWLRTLEE